MSILTDIQSIQTISSTSTQGIITTANNNFKKLANALFKFISEIEYDEDELSLGIKKLITDCVESNGTIVIKNDSGESISLDANGRIYANGSIRSKVNLEAPVVKVDYLASVPKYGNGGEIVYARNSEGEYDFFGYVNEVGWVSLTSGEGGGGVVPGGDGDGLESWSASVESIITELPQSPASGSKYVVSPDASGDLSEYAGQIAYYNELTASWEFVVPEDGSFVVVKDEGNAVYTSSSEGSTINWTAPSTSTTLGVETEGLHKFSASTEVSSAISTFDDDMYDIYNEALAAFNHMQGKGYSGKGSSSYYASKVYADSGCIYADSVSDNNEKVVMPITKISDTVYKVSLDENISRLLSPAYGIGFEAKLLKSGSYITSDGYFVEYNSGLIYFKETPENAPDSIEVYKYTGEFLSDKLGSSIVQNPDKNMHVPSDLPNSNFVYTGLTTSVDYRGYICVLINGVAASVCDTSSAISKKNYDCYFSVDSGTTPISYIESVVPAGAKLFWNAQTAGYTLDTNDVISFIYE